MGRVGDRVAVRVVKPLRKPATTFAMFETAGERSARITEPT
jgi:flagellar motor switch protein FliM